jgi:hypothetical protein
MLNPEQVLLSFLTIGAANTIGRNRGKYHVFARSLQQDGNERKRA